MKRKYDILFVTTMPSFYKVNLFNEIARKKKIFVLYTGSTTGKRSSDFIQESLAYDHKFLGGGIKSVTQVIRILKDNSFRKIIISGWDNIVAFVIAFLSRNKKECVVESSVYESTTSGWKAFPKKMLLKRMSKVLTSGVAQEELVRALGYKGNVVQFGGCGLLNYVEQPPFEPRTSVRNFLYVGQLIAVKNIGFIIDYFNKHSEYNLTIIGDGTLREELENKAAENIFFMGAINNTDLFQYYRKVDVFVLPSKSETWGLVVEEALNNGTPVIVSNRVGCASTLVIPNEVGCVFESNDPESFDGCIKNLTSLEYYNKLRYNASKLNFAERASHQVRCFCEE